MVLNCCSSKYISKPFKTIFLGVSNHSVVGGVGCLSILAPPKFQGGSFSHNVQVSNFPILHMGYCKWLEVRILTRQIPIFGG